MTTYTELQQKLSRVVDPKVDASKVNLEPKVNSMVQ